MDIVSCDDNICWWRWKLCKLTDGSNPSHLGKLVLVKLRPLTDYNSFKIIDSAALFLRSRKTTFTEMSEIRVAFLEYNNKHTIVISGDTHFHAGNYWLLEDLITLFLTHLRMLWVDPYRCMSCRGKQTTPLWMLTLTSTLFPKMCLVIGVIGR